MNLAKRHYMNIGYLYILGEIYEFRFIDIMLTLPL